MSNVKADRKERVKGERTVKAVAIVVFGLGAMAGLVWMLAFGPLSIRYITRVLEDTIEDLTVKETTLDSNAETLEVVTEPLTGGKLKLTLAIGTPRYITPYSEINVRVIRVYLYAEGYERVHSLESPVLNIFINPELGSLDPYATDNPDAITILLERGPMAGVYYSIDSSEERWTTYDVAGPKYFDIMVFFDPYRQPLGESYFSVEGKTRTLFNVEPDSVTINLWLSRGSFVLAVIAAPWALAEFFGGLYVLRDRRRAHKKTSTDQTVGSSEHSPQGDEAK